MIEKEKLLNLIGELNQKGIIDSFKKEKYEKLIEANNIDEVRGQLYKDLHEELAATDIEIIGAAIDYASLIREVSQKGGDEELLKIADDLDGKLKENLEIFDKEMDALNEENQELSPLLDEIESEAEKA